MEKIIKYQEYTTNEATYKVDDSGKFVKNEWELYKDWHPMKFKSLGKAIYSNIEFVWIIKKGDNIFSTFSSEINESDIENIFKKLSEPDNVNM